MAISDIPILSMLRTRMQWHQERQRLLAENVANADTPNFEPAISRRRSSTIRPRRSDRGIRTDAHDARPAATWHGVGLSQSPFPNTNAPGFEVRPAGNAVNLEDEMIKVAANQMDYQAATALYTRSLGLHQDRARQALGATGRGGEPWTS